MLYFYHFGHDAQCDLLGAPGVDVYAYRPVYPGDPGFAESGVFQSFDPFFLGALAAEGADISDL